jgi:hypothetical protein
MRCQPLIPYFPITISSSDQDFCINWPRRHEITGSPSPFNGSAKETLRANGLKGAYIRPIVFIGDGVMGIIDAIRGSNKKHLGWLDYIT